MVNRLWQAAALIFRNSRFSADALLVTIATIYLAGEQLQDVWYS